MKAIVNLAIVVEKRVQMIVNETHDILLCFLILLVTYEVVAMMMNIMIIQLKYEDLEVDLEWIDENIEKRDLIDLQDKPSI